MMPTVNVSGDDDFVADLLELRDRFGGHSVAKTLPLLVVQPGPLQRFLDNAREVVVEGRNRDGFRVEVGAL